MEEIDTINNVSFYLKVFFPKEEFLDHPRSNLGNGRCEVRQWGSIPTRLMSLGYPCSPHGLSTKSLTGTSKYVPLPRLFRCRSSPPPCLRVVRPSSSQPWPRPRRPRPRRLFQRHSLLPSAQALWPPCRGRRGRPRNSLQKWSIRPWLSTFSKAESRT
jgi:hypothetical protein